MLKNNPSFLKFLTETYGDNALIKEFAKTGGGCSTSGFACQLVLNGREGLYEESYSAYSQLRSASYEGIFPGFYGDKKLYIYANSNADSVRSDDHPDIPFKPVLR
jgi:hypothetical protein